jgi:hypothetical protein
MAIAVAQERTNFSTTGVTTYTLAFSNPVTAGSSIHVITACQSTSTTLACSDSVNGSYGAALDTVVSIAGGQTNAQWKFDATAAGTPAITVTSTTPTTISIWIREISGTSGYDSTATPGHNAQEQVSPGTGTNAVSSGNMTPSVAPGLVSGIAGEVVGSAGYTPGTGFTLGVYGDNTMTESLRYTSTATLAATFTDSNGTTGDSVTMAILFKETPAASVQIPRMDYLSQSLRAR